MIKGEFPPGWDLDRVKRILADYEPHRKKMMAARDKYALNAQKRNTIEIPTELVPKVLELIEQHKAA